MNRILKRNSSINLTNTIYEKYISSIDINSENDNFVNNLNDLYHILNSSELYEMDFLKLYKKIVVFQKKDIVNYDVLKANLEQVDIYQIFEFKALDKILSFIKEYDNLVTKKEPNSRHNYYEVFEKILNDYFKTKKSGDYKKEFFYDLAAKGFFKQNHVYHYPDIYNVDINKLEERETLTGVEELIQTSNKLYSAVKTYINNRIKLSKKIEYSIDSKKFISKMDKTSDYEKDGIEEVTIEMNEFMKDDIDKKDPKKHIKRNIYLIFFGSKKNKDTIDNNGRSRLKDVEFDALDYYNCHNRSWYKYGIDVTKKEPFLTHPYTDSSYSKIVSVVRPIIENGSPIGVNGYDFIFDISSIVDDEEEAVIITDQALIVDNYINEIKDKKNILEVISINDFNYIKNTDDGIIDIKFNGTTKTIFFSKLSYGYILINIKK